MSLPSMHRVCDACGEIAKLGPYPPSYYLTEKDGPLPVRWSIGWCASCGHARQMEDWPSAKQLVEEGGEIIATTIVARHQQAAPDHAERRSGWLARLFGRAARSAPDPVPVASSYEAQRLADLQLHHRLLDLRRSPNRCMQCGGTEVQLWPLRREPSVSPPHPGCGGHFVPDGMEDGVRLNYRCQANLFTFAGRPATSLGYCAPNFARPPRQAPFCRQMAANSGI